MTKYQQYMEYKDSGVEWLEHVPKEWDIIKIKHLSSVKRGASPRPIDDPKYFDDNGKYAWVRIADVSASDTYLHSTTQTMSDLGSSLSVKLEPNELFLSIAGTVGRPCINKIKACIHDGFVYFPDLKIPNKFLFYVFAGEQAYKGLGKMGTQLNLNTDTVGDIKVALPKSVEDIQTIVNFLDHEAAKIDSLIEKQQQLIQLLKEKRQAVISHAVTKGLNPNVPMKDSGVEWLGEIPSHWGTVFLKMVIDVRDGTHETPAYVEPTINSYPLVTSKDVTGGWVDLSECKHISESDYRSIIKRSNVAKGDILMPMIGTVGSPVIVKDELEIAIKNLALFRTSDENLKIYKKFLYYFLNSEECNIQFILEGRGGVQNFVSLGTLRNLRLPYLSLNEQTEIADFLDYETTKIDHLINKVKQQIQLMQERRTALISAAVTGKIDVRNWQNPNNNNEAKTEFSA